MSVVTEFVPLRHESDLIPRKILFPEDALSIGTFTVYIAQSRVEPPNPDDIFDGLDYRTISSQGSKENFYTWKKARDAVPKDIAPTSPAFYQALMRSYIGDNSLVLEHMLVSSRPGASYHIFGLQKSV